MGNLPLSLWIITKEPAWASSRGFLSLDAHALDALQLSAEYNYRRVRHIPKAAQENRHEPRYTATDDLRGIFGL